MKVKQTGFLNKEELQTEDLLSLPVLFSQSLSAAFFWEEQGDLLRSHLVCALGERKQDVAEPGDFGPEVGEIPKWPAQMEENG